MMLGCLVLIASLTRGTWIPAIGGSLVCKEADGPVDTILVENFDLNYLVFEQAAALQRTRVGARTLIPTEASSDPEIPGMVSAGIVEVMARVSRLPHPEMIPVRETEPISLNEAYQIRDFLRKEHIKSVVVVTPGFRSRRSLLVYEAVFGKAGISVACVPVFGERTPQTWARTWHGIQDVIEQLLKLQYYRLYVLPFVEPTIQR